MALALIISSTSAFWRKEITNAFFSITATFSLAIFSIESPRYSSWSKPIFPMAIIGLRLWAVVASNLPPKPASSINKSTFLKSKKTNAQQIICSKGDNLCVERVFAIFLKSF